MLSKMTCDTCKREHDLEQANCGYCTYLYALQVSGVVNMFGAPKYMSKNLGIPYEDALAAWTAWTEGYKQEYSRPS